MSEINELVKEIHEDAENHGWWDKEREFGTIIALVHSELSEALEEYRNGKPMAYFRRNTSTFPQYESFWKDETDLLLLKPNDKPEGIAVELVDAVIRIFDYFGEIGVNLEELIRIKMDYNKTRPYKHGGKVV